MKTPIRFLSLLVLFPFLLASQTPGYVGKKTVVGYGMHLNPVIFGSTANNKTLLGNANGSAERGYYRFNYSHDFFVERAISTYWLMGISLKYLRTGYDNRISLGAFGKSPTEYYQINALTVNPYFKKYYSRYIAPWGKYFIIGPSITMMRSKHDAFMYIRQTVNNHDTLITDFGSDAKRHYSADLLLGFGRNRIFFNNISLDYGFNFQFFSFISTLVSSTSVSTGYFSHEEYISETIKERVRTAYWLNVFLKVGYIF